MAVWSCGGFIYSFRKVCAGFEWQRLQLRNWRLRCLSVPRVASLYRRMRGESSLDARTVENL